VEVRVRKYREEIPGIENLGCISGTDPMGLEEDHYLADLLLIGPGFFDHPNPFSANAIDFAELCNLLFYGVSFANFLTIRLAMTGPMPLISPDPRYFQHPPPGPAPGICS